MSRTDHAIENAIYSFYNYKDKPDPLAYWREHDPNLEGMSDEKIDTIQAAAEYIVYSLCDGGDDESYYQLIHKADEWWEKEIAEYNIDQWNQGE